MFFSVFFVSLKRAPGLIPDIYSVSELLYMRGIKIDFVIDVIASDIAVSSATGRLHASDVEGRILRATATAQRRLRLQTAKDHILPIIGSAWFSCGRPGIGGPAL